MQVLYSGTLDVNAGGPAMSTYLTMKGLRDQGINVQLIMPLLSENGRLYGEEVDVHYSNAPMESKFQYTPSLKKTIQGLGDFDIYHAQGIWTYPTYALIDIAKGKQKPYIITPRGMLYPQDIAKSSTFFKKISLKWRLLNDFNHVACVHVTCEEEMQHCRNLGITAPMAVIPNPVEIHESQYQKEDDLFRLGYLGRVSPRKNIQSLIYAFADLREKKKDIELLIIGGGDVEYEKFLRQEAQRLELNNVRFTGFLSGKDKEKAITSCSVIAMPSEFENFGNVIVEGLSYGIPCIATQGAPWKDLEDYHCGWWIPYHQEAITHAISDAMDRSPQELREMGTRGKQMVEQKYAVSSVALQMKELYHWVLGMGTQPDFVHG